MKTKLLFLLSLVFPVFAFAQSYAFGNVAAEENEKAPNVVVINMRTGEKILTDTDGYFMIAAKSTDELRFVKSGFDRVDLHLSAKNFSEPIAIVLQRVPYTIPEVEIAFQASGDIKKDTKLLDPPKKVVALNAAMSDYMKSPQQTPLPVLKTPSAFEPQSVNAVQVNPFALIGAVIKLIKKSSEPTKTTANYAETQQFFREVKSQTNLQIFVDRGMTEEDIDRFLIYADNSMALAKKYRKNFNAQAIENELKLAYVNYSKNH